MLTVCLRQLVTGLSLGKARFIPRMSQCERFVVDKVVLGQVSLKVLKFLLSVSFH